MTRSGYEIRVLGQKTLRSWRAFESAYPTEMGELKTFLWTGPTNIRITDGKCKKLTHKLEHLYQYDITYSERVWYSVHKTERVVRIRYIGEHPN